jgi:spermidine synthase
MAVKNTVTISLICADLCSKQSTFNTGILNIMRNRSFICISLTSLGGFTIPAQIYFVREFLVIFNGNEMALGTVIGLWLLLTGAGVWLARTFPVKRGPWSFATFLMLLLSILPILAIFKLQLWKATALPYGSMPGLWEMVYSTFFTILPFCICNGYLFILLTSMLKETDADHAPGKAYAWESFGGLLGGAMVNFVLLWFVDSLSALRILSVSFVVMICLTSSPKNPSILLSVYLSSILLILFILLFPFTRLSQLTQFRDQEVLLDKETPYGKVTVTKSGEQLNYYGDGTLLFSSGNTMWNEESVHYAMLQRPHARNVLMIGGGISGAIPEVLKYNPERIDYVEINPVIADLARRYVGNTRLTNLFIHRTDIRSFLAGEERRYDFVLVNMPEPSSLQLNRYYTSEFALLLKHHMRPGGVASFSLPPTTDYVSPEAGLMNGSLYRTLGSVFGKVIIVPGNRNWFLASDSALSLAIARLSDKRITDKYSNISSARQLVHSSVHQIPENEFVNSYYIDDGLLSDRSAYILKNLPADPPVNRDFHPVIYRQQISIWLSQFGMGWPLIVGVVSGVFILLLFFLNRTGAVLFAAGFTGVSLEIMVILALEVALGYVFSMVGVVIMVFMAGLSLGPWLVRRLFPDPGKKHFVLLQLFMSALPVLMLLTVHCSLLTVQCSLLFATTLITSVTLGMLYPLSVVVTPGDPIRAASRNYAADLFGSAMGAFLVPVVLIPAAGMGITLFLMTIICLSATIINIWK